MFEHKELTLSIHSPTLLQGQHGRCDSTHLWWCRRFGKRHGACCDLIEVALPVYATPLVVG